MAVQLLFYDKWAEYHGDGTADLDGDTFIMLLLNTSHTFTATNNVLTQVTANEISGNGYARDTLTQTWVESAGTVTFDSDDGTFTASGGSITASDGVIFDDTPTSPADPLVCSIDFDGNQSAGDGTNFLVQPNASGWWTSSYTDA